MDISSNNLLYALCAFCRHDRGKTASSPDARFSYNFKDCSIEKTTIAPQSPTCPNNISEGPDTLQQLDTMFNRASGDVIQPSEEEHLKFAPTVLPMQGHKLD